MQRLVSEDISVRNLRAILEAMVEWGQKEKDVVQLTEYIRCNLKRYICYKYSNGQNVLPAYLLDPSLENLIREGIRPDVRRKLSGIGAVGNPILC